MAFNSGGALGGGASGAAIGTQVGGPGWGTAIGAVGGAALGGFLGGKKSYKSPHFSDIDLQRENPELWKQLQSLNAMADQAEYLYKQKVQNDSAIQAREVGQGLTSLNDKLSNAGLLGTSAGLSSSVDGEARLREQIAQKVYAEQQQAMQAAQSARSNYLNQYSAAQKDVFAPMLAESQANFAQDQAYAQNRNQMITSGLGALAGAYGQQRNQSLMAAQRAQDQQYMLNLYGKGPAVVPQGYSYGSGVSNYYGGNTAYPNGANYPSYGGD